MTFLGNNIQAIEVDGTFDDCQALVKQAFNDVNLRQKIDHLIIHQQQDLLEIQKVQIEMMNDILTRLESHK